MAKMARLTAKVVIWYTDFANIPIYYIFSADFSCIFRTFMKGECNMIQIAICDDEVEDIEYITSLIRKHLSSATASIQTFSSSEVFLRTLGVSFFDILFLDIEMESPTGYEVAQRLHAIEDSTLIIFVTKSSRYTLKGYGLVFRYLLKPLQEEDLTKALDAAISEIKSNRLSFKYDGDLFSIPISNIIYIESFGHFSTIHTETAEYVVRQTLTELLQQLSQSLFSFSHKSYLINMKHILCASSKEVQMSNHDLLPISRRKKESFNSTLNNYLGR